jgi:hypothetical protein
MMKGYDTARLGRVTCGICLVVGLAAPPAGATAAPRTQARSNAPAAKELPPLSYVCPMPGDEDVIDDKPGSCPTCHMTLVPLRLDAAPVRPGAIANTLEAHFPSAQAALPLRLTAAVKFSATGKAQPFDFQFNEFSKDPAPSAAVRPALQSPNAQRQVDFGDSSPFRTAPAVGVAGRTAQRIAVRTAALLQWTAAQAPAAAPPTQPSAPGRPPDLLAGEIAPMPPALAAALDESVLPKGVPALLDELRKRVSEVDSLVKQGSLAEVWLPAMATKTVALVLGDHARQLPGPKQAQATSAVSRVVTAAWLIDGYGDLGDRGKIVGAYDQLTAAIADLEEAFADVQ